MEGLDKYLTNEPNMTEPKNKVGAPKKDYTTRTVSERVLSEYHEVAKAKIKKVLKPYKPKK